MSRDYVRFNSFCELNREFRDSTETLLEDFFCPEGLSSEGYLPVGVYNKKLAERFSTSSENQENIFAQSKGFENIGEFSLYENLLASHILYGRMRTLVISGAMGSGKSTTIDFILESLKSSDIGKENIIIKLDFNKGFSSRNIDEIYESFLRDLYAKLKTEIVKNFAKLGLSDDFLKIVDKEYKAYTHFYDFSFEKLYLNDKSWRDSDEMTKIYLLLKYIETKATRLEHQVEMVMKLLNYFGEKLTQFNARVIIFYDNIDKLPPVAQFNILNKIIAFNHIANITKLIAIRRSTKAKLDQIIERESTSIVGNRAQTVYGHIYHHGPSPWKLYQKKVEILEERIENISLFKHLSPNIKKSIKIRAHEVKNELEKRHSDLKKAIYCISGESNRLGLTLASRNFCNGIYPFDDKILNSRSLVRSIYCGFNQDNIISSKDEFVANIFSNNKYEFDIINFLIFQIIQQENLKENPKLNSIHLYDFLLHHFEYRNNEIIDALNYLLKDKRALIGGQYYPNYKNSDELYRIDDDLRITELGERYFKELIEKGTIYIQTCLFSLKWDFGSDKVHRDQLSNRLDFLIKMLHEAMEVEQNKHMLYLINREEFTNVPEYKFESIICKVCLPLFNEFSRIVMSIPNNRDLVDLLDLWVERIAEWSFLYEETFGEQIRPLLLSVQNTVANKVYKK
ncbi:P-loop NTPase fold protein [Winogradskyella flava]|uniref:P-loop NTPase fold protein n=1 Tax=Winogradskyella flava TaxID=1884876 RepID=UPI0024922334|nr:P-loop NTPase fold protein [Winogradskyella flava]